MDLLRRLREEAVKSVQRGTNARQKLTKPRKDILPFQQQRRQIGQSLNSFTRKNVTPAATSFGRQVGSDLSKGFQSGMRLANPSYAYMQDRKQGLNWLQSQGKGFQDIFNVGRAGSYAFGAPRIATKAGAALLGSSGLIGGAFNKSQGGSFSEGFGQGAASAIPIAGITRFTNPLIEQNVARIAPKLPLKGKVATFAGQGLVRGVQNVPEGAVIDAALNRRPLGFESMALDLATGFLPGSPSVRSKANVDGINPRAYKMHPDDIQDAKDALDILRGQMKGDKGDALKTVQNLLEGYAPGYKYSTNAKAYKVLENLIQTNEKLPREMRTPMPSMGFVDDSVASPSLSKPQNQLPQLQPVQQGNRVRIKQAELLSQKPQMQAGNNPYGGIIPQLSAPNTPLALPGRYVAKTPSEAQRLFKKTGIAPELEFSQRGGSKPIKIKGETPFYNAEANASPRVKLRNEKAQAQQAQKEFNDWQKEMFRRENATRTITGAVDDASRALGSNTRSMASSNIIELKDISSPATQFVDVFRNFRKVYGKRYDEVKKVVLDPLFVKGKKDLLDDQEMWIKRISSEVEEGFGIKKGSPQSADVQKYGEGLISQDDLIKKYGNKGANTIIEADKWFRKNYNQLLDEVNSVRAKIYPNNPDKIIPKRKDYYRHFNELSQGIDGLLNTLGRAVDVSPQLAGISYKTKPKSKWLSFAQKRLGGKTEYDAVGGFIDYVKAQTYAKHIDPHIDTFRQLGRELGEAGVENNKGLNNFTLFLEQFADELSGKTNPADRFIQQLGGRKPMAVLNWFNQRTKANVILGNASSMVAQVFNLPNGIAEAGPRYATKGFGRAIASMFEKNRPMDQSTFLRERYFRGFEKFDRGIINDGRKFAAWMITVLDEMSTKSIWNMMYEKGKAQGLKGQQLVNYADEVTRRMVGGRGIGEMPLIQRSKAFQLVAPFQLEVTNAWHVIGDMVGERAFGKLITLAVTSYIMNRAAEQVRGSDVSFDPIQAAVEGIEAFNEEDDKKIGALRLGGRLGGELLSNIPLGQTAATWYPEYGFKVNDFEAPTREQFFGKGDPTRYGSGLLAIKGLQDPLFKLAPPYGGQQIKRTLEGIGTTLRGYSETPSGNVRFPTENSPLRNIQRAVFGQYSTPEAREYFDENRRPLGEKQSEIFRNLSGAERDNYYQSVMSNREKENAIDELKEQVKVEGGSTSVGDTFVYYDPDSGESKTIDVSKFRDEPEGALAKAKWEKERWSKAKEIFNSPLENKNEIIESIGLDPADVEYYDFASQTNDIKSMVIREELGSLTNREQMLQKLVEFRREINGEMVLTSGVIDSLEDEGLITDAEAKYLKKLEFGENGVPKVKVSGRGRGAKLKGVKWSDVKNVMGVPKIPTDIESIDTTLTSPTMPTPNFNFTVPDLGVGQGGGIPSLPNFRVKFNL